jgi:hypothetical protein
MGVTPTDLSAIKSGRGGNEFDRLARALEDLVDKRAAKKAAETIRYMNNLIGA